MFAWVLTSQSFLPITFQIKEDIWPVRIDILFEWALRGPF